MLSFGSFACNLFVRAWLRYKTPKKDTRLRNWFADCVHSRYPTAAAGKGHEASFLFF
jgi:hypothetical protein